MILAQLNAHPRDVNIKFTEEGHKYSILTDLNTDYISVTTFVHDQFEKFDTDGIIKKMMNGRKWNKDNKYFYMTADEIKTMWKTNGTQSSSLGTILHYGIELFMNQPFLIKPSTKQRCHIDLLNYFNSNVKMLCSYDINQPIFKNTLENKDTDTDTDIIGNTPTPTKDVSNLIDTWNILQDSVSFSSFNQNDVMVEWNMFLRFIAKYADLIPYRTEWLIYDEKLKISGSVDMVYKNSNGTYDIYDWKRSKGITKTNMFDKYSTTDCINYIPDTNYWHYTLQLNIYKRILEDNYNITINKLKLVILHPIHNNFMILDVKIMNETINDLYSNRLYNLIQSNT
jgi:hypothetical protein